MSSESIEQLFQELRSGDRGALSRAITIVESTLESDRQTAIELYSHCLEIESTSWRIGVTGVPGVGKSTFIDVFGSMLCEKEMKVAVLAVDPSSQRSKGSILGDKTRMENLSLQENAFIRPSPTSETLGGITMRTRECLALCEAAGYDVILVETVGVGQSETAVHEITDLFLLLMLANAGDELQGIKRGVMEMADILLLHKADAEDLTDHQIAVQDYRNALHLFPSRENGWEPKVEMVSSIQKSGLDEVFKHVERFFDHMTSSGRINESRRKQDVSWFVDRMNERIQKEFLHQDGKKTAIAHLKERIREGSIDAHSALRQLFSD